MLQPVISYGDDEASIYRDCKPPITVQSEELLEIYELIGKTCENINKSLCNWKRLEALFLSRPGYVEYSTELVDWVDLIKELNKQRKEISALPGQKEIGCFTIDTSKVREPTLKKIDEWSRYAIGKIQSLSNSKLNELLNEIDESSSKIHQQIPTLARELAEFLRNFKEGNDRQVNWESCIPTFEESLKYCQIDDLPKFKISIDQFKIDLEEKRNEIEANKATLRGKGKARTMQ